MEDRQEGRIIPFAPDCARHARLLQTDLDRSRSISVSWRRIGTTSAGSTKALRASAMTRSWSVRECWYRMAAW
jgi:hypothetical protein